MSKNYDRIYSVSFILLTILICISVIIIGATGGKYGVFLLLTILLNATYYERISKKYEHYSNKGRI
ncbi:MULTISPECIES: hypothetical protein [Bacillus cereus group]|uniref:hypothetical protein n=1 Tax=Bacillus cereus group TaxID=86661 RepID=UPI001CC23BCF|nr:hypothetical protein [Bacillus cereus]